MNCLLCHHCNHYANLSFKVNDTVQINSDPEDDDDPQSHIHQGTVLKIKPSKKQITIRMENHDNVTYFWPTIAIHTATVYPLCERNHTEVTQMKELIAIKDKKIAGMKWKLKKYKANLANEHELQQKLNAKDETIHNLKVLLQNTELETDELKTKNASLQKEKDALKTQLNTFQIEIDEQQYILRESYEIHERIEKEKEQRVYKNTKYELQNEQLSEDILHLKQELENEKLDKERYQTVAEMEQDKRFEFESKYEKAVESLRKSERVKYDLRYVANELERERILREKYEKKVRDYRMAHAAHLRANQQLREDVEEVKKDKEEIVSTVLIQVETEQNQKFILAQEKLLTEQQYEAEKNQKNIFKQKAEEEEKEKLLKEQQYEAEKNQKNIFKKKAEEEEQAKLAKEQQYEAEKNQKNIFKQKAEEEEKEKLLKEQQYEAEKNQKNIFKQKAEEEEKQRLEKEQELKEKADEYKRLRERIENMDAPIKYPAYWDKAFMTDRNYAVPKLKDMTAHPKAQEVINSFFVTVPRNQYNVIKVESVQNQMLYDKYMKERDTMKKLIGVNNLKERLVFHGTRSEDVMALVEKEGFRKEFNNAAAYGYGTYLARDASYSVGYSSNTNGLRKMFQCTVIVGQSHTGSHAYKLRSWPKKPNGLIYDSLVDNTANPSIFVIHNDVRIYPLFVIHFRLKQQ